MSVPTKDDKAIMFASVCITVPVYAWIIGLLAHFVIEPYGLNEPWFVLPFLVTIAGTFIWSWAMCCQFIKWLEERYPAAIDSQPKEKP